MAIQTAKSTQLLLKLIIIIIITRSGRQQRLIASTPRDHDWQPCAIPFWCQMESRLQCGGATSDVDDRVVYASVSLDGCSLSHRWLAAGLDVLGRYSPALQHGWSSTCMIMSSALNGGWSVTVLHNTRILFMPPKYTTQQNVLSL